MHQNANSRRLSATSVEKLNIWLVFAEVNLRQADLTVNLLEGPLTKPMCSVMMMTLTAYLLLHSQQLSPCLPPSS